MRRPEQIGSARGVGLDDGAPSPTSWSGVACRVASRKPPHSMSRFEGIAADKESLIDEERASRPGPPPPATRSARAARGLLRSDKDEVRVWETEHTPRSGAPMRIPPAAEIRGLRREGGSFAGSLPDAFLHNDYCPMTTSEDQEDLSPDARRAIRVFKDGSDGQLSAQAKQLLLPAEMRCARTAMCTMTVHEPPTRLQQLSLSQSSSSICPICCESLGDDAVSFSCGIHYFCRDCTAKHIKTSLSQNKMPRCLDECCSAEPWPDVWARLLDSNADLERYFLVQLRNTQDLRDCPRCHTTMCVPVSSPGGLQHRSRSMRCPSCNLRLCKECGCMRGKEHDCDAARQELCMRRQAFADPALKDAMAELQLKACPKCGQACEKADANCDHMTCVQCSHEFCWLCLRDRSIIFAHGNHYHSPSCRHFRDFNGEPELELKCSRCVRRGRPCTPPRLRIKPFKQPEKKRSLWSPFWHCW